MKDLFRIFVLNLFVVILSGQGLQKKYVYANYITPIFKGINIYNDQIWTFGSLTRPEDNVDELMINKLDNEGNLLACSIFKDDSTYHWFNVGMTRLNDELFTVSNDPYISSSLVKFNTKTFQFKKALTFKSDEKENTFFSCHDFTLVDSNNFILSFVDNSKNINYGQSNVKIIKIKQSGEVLWEYKYRIFNFHCYPNKIKVLKNSQIIIGCIGVKDGGFTVKDHKSIVTFFIHLTKDGNLIKIVTADKVYATINDFIYQEDGGYTCVGADTVHTNLKDLYSVCPIILKLDSTGKEMWIRDVSDRKLSYPGFEQMNFVEYDSTTNQFISAGMGRYNSELLPLSKERYFTVIAFRNNGEVEWNKVVRNHIAQRQDYCYGMRLINNNIYLIGSTGTFDLVLNNYITSAILIKLNMQGCIEENCIDINIDSSKLLFTFGPNPVHNEMTIYSNELEDVNIKVYSLEGKLMLTYLIPPFSYHKSISTMELDNGIYLIEAINTKTNIRFIDKLIVQNH
ncbi:MAG: T9SS type A sorting domain-containing protein [Saprospiraceae bacterium]|nr:T9SS type A sorting domain-containing protein [Candidatus Defluviibacterium haderslevense]